MTQERRILASTKTFANSAKSLLSALLQIRLKLFNRQWPTKQISLIASTATVMQELSLFFRLDPFVNDIQAQHLSHGYDSAHDCFIAAIDEDIAHECLVYPELIERQPAHAPFCGDSENQPTHSSSAKSRHRAFYWCADPLHTTMTNF
jgi:hypothetical protein